MEFLKELGTSFLEGILPALLGLLVVYCIEKVVSLIKAKTESLVGDRERMLIWDALRELEELTTKTVTALEQTVAKELRGQIKNGNATRESLLELAEQAALDITVAMRPESKRIITEHYGDFNRFVDKCIEAKVLELKKSSQGV